VIAGTKIEPWRVATHQPTLWLNPWAEMSITGDFGWETRHLDLDSSRLGKTVATIDAATLFGLPKDFPGPEDLED
jgi:hypothetical protein